MKSICFLVVPTLLILTLGAQANELMIKPGSRILATSAASPIEGGAGGGIVPFALIGGYGSDTEIGASAFVTRVSVDDFDLQAVGLAVGFYNRLELSYTRQTLDVNPLDIDISQDIFGAKYRLAGDLIYNRLPQVTIGIQYKKNRDFAVPALVGAEDDSGVDAYLSASKLYLGGLAGYNVLLNGTLRYTEANQTGLLGFGSNGGNAKLVFEGAAGVFLSRHLALGIEYRQKPDELGLKEDDWMDVFVAWFPSKRISIVGAWADLGDIAGLQDQTGWYASIQLTQ